MGASDGWTNFSPRQKPGAISACKSACKRRGARAFDAALPGHALSRNENARSGGDAALEIAVRLGGVLERVALIDRDLHLAARHGAEQVVGDRQQILAF